MKNIKTAKNILCFAAMMDEVMERKYNFRWEDGNLHDHFLLYFESFDTQHCWDLHFDAEGFVVRPQTGRKQGTMQKHVLSSDWQGHLFSLETLLDEAEGLFAENRSFRIEQMQIRSFGHSLVAGA